MADDRYVITEAERKQGGCKEKRKIIILQPMTMLPSGEWSDQAGRPFFLCGELTIWRVKCTRRRKMQYRNARIEDIPGVARLQSMYHVSTISPEDKPDGFVTTLFTEAQFRELIEAEDGLAIACAGDEVIAYAMAASWHYWSAWPLFQHMIEDLPNVVYLGQRLSTENSYQYGPICIRRDYRGTEVLPNLFEFSRRQMAKRYPILITFINTRNPRSFRAHTKKLGLEVIKTFTFNDNLYYELGYDMSKPTPNHTLGPE